MSKVRYKVLLHERGVAYYLIIGYMASGAKLAGTYYRLLYGTREVITALQNGEASVICKVGYSKLNKQLQISVASGEDQNFKF